MEITDEKFVAWGQAKKILETKEKEKELGYEQKNALEFLKKFSKLSEKKITEAVGELSKIGKLKERQIAMLIDMAPQDMDELNVLFSNEIITPGEEDRKKILTITKKLP